MMQIVAYRRMLGEGIRIVPMKDDRQHLKKDAEQPDKCMIGAVFETKKEIPDYAT
jgi:hypothetical protein